MNAKSIAMGVVAMVVATVLVVTCAVPIISDSVATEDTYKNEGYFHLDKYTDGYTLTWDATDPNVFVVNGEEINYVNNSGLSLSIALGTNYAVRLAPNNERISFYASGNYVSTSESYPTFSLTFAEGSVIATNQNVSHTVQSVTELYGMTENGPYVMKKADKVAYLNSGSEIVADSEIYATGQTFHGNNNILWHLEGSIDDMEYPDTFNAGLTISNQSINGSFNNTHEDLYELSNITFTATASNSVVYNVTASYFVVPYEVTAERTVQVDGATGDIISVIPVLMVLGIVIGAVALFLTNRRD